MKSPIDEIVKLGILAMSRVIVTGTVGRVSLIAALSRICNDVVICEAEKGLDQFQQEPFVIKNLHDLGDRVFCKDLQRKSKGHKRRERSERRRKWGI